MVLLGAGMTPDETQQRADDAEEVVRRAWILTRSAQAVEKLAAVMRQWVHPDCEDTNG